jgi:CxC2 like cysteine cluster associated with KDZ transposases
MYLFQLLDKETPPHNHNCMSCEQCEGAYRCSDCFGKNWFCKDCCVKEHGRNPFHRIQAWNGDHFTDTSLKNLGLVLYLGHDGYPCPALHQDGSFPIPSSAQSPSPTSTLTIIDRLGVHEHNVQWCQCPNGQSRDIILLCMGLFSASIHHPKTAFTFQCLHYFHIDSMECQTSARNFYTKLQRLTNETFPDNVKVRSYLIHFLIYCSI